MAKEKTLSTSSSLLQELFQFGIYKRTQGRITRQVTCVAMMVVFGLAAWQLGQLLRVTSLQDWAKYLIPGLVLVVGLWASFRAVNLPRFADFLIAVEAEMNKVSWPSWNELRRASLVVIFVVFAMMALLFGFDMIWQTVFEWVGVRPSADGS